MMGMNMASRNPSAQDISRPTVYDLQESNPWVQVAKSLWLKDSAMRRVKHDLIKKEIWDRLESESFTLKSLLILENLQILER
jgi:intron-binding protein aquarius